MTTPDIYALERAIRDMPACIAGPGGLAGAVVNGETVLAHSWGFADPDRRVPMTDRLQFPICSVTKQFTCGVLLDLVDDPARLDDRVAAHLPAFEGRPPSVRDLCHMQSGLRDTWALTVLHGAHPEGRFRREDAAPLISAMRGMQFEPGTRYSYSNGNFRILAALIEEQAGCELGELYAERIFGPAGMEAAIHTPDTAAPVGGVVGYEGNERVGYRPATNRIYWTGDAGISASLRDMLAWERHIQSTADDDRSLYARLSAPQSFANGAPARYGFGLAHGAVAGIPTIGHGGALRGFRLYRLHVPSARLSVVVMFNHEADAHAAATGLAKAALGWNAQPQDAESGDGWIGRYLIGETGLSLRVDAQDGGLAVRYATATDALTVGPDGVARSFGTMLTRVNDGLLLERPGENLRSHAVRLGGEALFDVAGSYRSPETGGTLEVVEAGGAFHAGFEGQLGRGPMHALHPIAEDVWIMACPRAMDAPAPGDWTFRIARDCRGSVRGVTVGCWLARGVIYVRTA